ncbi:ubiquitin-like domain-containing protein [Evansella sp. AB-P1]|uniref:ubiquitin-like domain-containing protein n=1 Tax=Evansella sp. AB-P1 TaxID=3037653 RepID=UPI00241DF3F8|nr:ubiquitin-like domain-containing protein [Evansella sp. AB-P1]MDG5789971.1 ubiquitin-like domain-containing protein [Evansella sp. AB-P1]
MTQWMKRIFSEFSWRKFAISSVGLLTLMGILIFAIYEVTKTSVTVSLNDENITVYTHASTVGEVLEERGIDVSVHDYIEPSIDTTITDALKITYTPAQQIFVNIDGEAKDIWTVSGTVEELMDELGITVNEHDVIEPSLEKELTDEIKVTYEPSYAVTLFSDGEENKVWTTSTTIGDLLEKENITLNELDKVEPAIDDEINEDTDVNIVRVEKVTDVVEETIDFATVKRNDSSLERGSEEVVESGQEGRLKKHYEVIFEDGEEVSRELVKEEMVQESQDRIVAVGTKAPPAPPAPAQNQTVSRGSGEWSSFIATKYTAFCPTGCTGVTATGIDVSNTITHNGNRVIATDPSVIPMYSLVEVRTPNETFVAQALDTGGAIQGNKIDILVNSRSEAMNFGIQNVQIRVIRRGR